MSSAIADSTNRVDNDSHGAQFPTKEELKDDEEVARFPTQTRFHDEKGRQTHHCGPVPGDNDFHDTNAPIQFVVNEWAQGTSIHGVPFVTDTIMWRAWKRTMWFVLVCVSTGFMIWQFTALIQQYRSFEVITDVETMNPTSLEFPEVTICNMNTFSKRRMEELGIQQPMNEQELISISIPLEEMIDRAWFNGRELNVSKVFTPTFMEWGLCWRFHTEERITRPGFFGGLRVWGDLRQPDYDMLSTYAGLSAWTQMPGTLITNQLPIFAIRAGQETLVHIYKTEFQRESQQPWARCKSKAPDYTQSRCRTECVDKEVARICGCRRYTDATAPKSIPLCHRLMDFEQNQNCADLVMANESSILEECDCELPPCSQIEYEGNTIDADRSEVFLDNFNYSAVNVTRAYVEKNWVSLTVNYAKIQYDLVTESKAMTFADLLASIGGSMGFFLGISMLSIFELVGDLGLLRLAPRVFGQKHLYGLGAQKNG